MRRVKSYIYCMYLNITMKTLLYENHSKPKYMSIILTLLLAVGRVTINYVA